MSKKIIVGELKQEITNALNSSLPNLSIYMYPGFTKHIQKRHPDCLKYINDITEIIKNPDYIGIHPKEQDSIEFIKVLDKNIMIAIKLETNTENEYLYLASLYDISQGKINNRLNSQRLIHFNSI